MSGSQSTVEKLESFATWALFIEITRKESKVSRNEGTFKFEM